MTAAPTTASLVPGEVGTAGAQAVLDLTARAIGGTPVADYVEQDPMPWSVLADGGWDQLGVPEEEGGGGASVVDLVAVARAWGRTCVPLPFLTTLLAKRWSAAAREHDGPVGLAVPEAGDPDRAVLPFGAFEGLGVLRAADAPLEPPPEGAVDDWVPSLRPVASPWASDLGEEQAAELATVWAAEASGGADRLLELSVEHAREREQFGKPLGSFQAVKHRLASMKVLTESVETAVLWAAVEPAQASRAARWATDRCVTVAEHAIQVHGGMGFTWELGLHHHLRHLVTLRALVRGTTA